MNLFTRRVKLETNSTWRISFPSLLNKLPFFKFFQTEENISISIFKIFSICIYLEQNQQRLFETTYLLGLLSGYVLGSCKQKFKHNQVSRKKIHFFPETEGTAS